MASTPAARRLAVRNPRTGETDAWIAPLDAAAVARVAAALRAAQPAWASLGPDARAAALGAFAEAIDRHFGAISAALSVDTGRGGIARMEVRTVAGIARKWAAAAPRLITGVEGAGWQASAMPGVRHATRLVPYPLVGVIAPWNFPLILSLTDALPALAAGCAVLVKPSEITPRFAVALTAALAEVPDLAAVLRLIDGDGATGAAVVEAVDFIAFTGSVATGRRVAALAAHRFIPASLELGGKDPMIIVASADPVAAAATALRASVLATGQACQSIERIYVHAAIAAPFLTALVAAAEAVDLNADAVERGHLGPFIHAPQAAIVQAQIDDAVAHGATLRTGGRVETHGGGLYLRPTVLTGVTPAMAVMRDETFGPVLPVTVFDDLGTAVVLANGGAFGLSAAVLAGSLDEAAAVAVRLTAGAVSLNDGALTAFVSDAEKSSFGLSGMGPSRAGDAGLLRFFRKQALYAQDAVPRGIDAFGEGALP